MSEYMKSFESLKDPTRQQVVNLIVEEAVKFTSSKIGYFAVMNDSEDELTMLGWSKSAMDACAMIDKPIVYPLEQTGLWGDCIRERKPVITNNYEESTRVTKKGYPSGHVKVVRHVNVPMHGDGKLTGILGVGNKESDYSDTDVKALQEFADDAWKYLKKAK